LLLLKTFKALNGLLCADVPLRNYSLTHSLWASTTNSTVLVIIDAGYDNTESDVTDSGRKTLYKLRMWICRCCRRLNAWPLTSSIPISCSHKCFTCDLLLFSDPQH